LCFSRSGVDASLASLCLLYRLFGLAGLLVGGRCLRYLAGDRGKYGPGLPNTRIRQWVRLASKRVAVGECNLCGCGDEEEGGLRLASEGGVMGAESLCRYISSDGGLCRRCRAGGGGGVVSLGRGGSAGIREGRPKPLVVILQTLIIILQSLVILLRGPLISLRFL
jgi:hypothetical protein